MDTGRLGMVRRQENSHRKYICILNDVIKSKWETEDQCLTREKFEIGVKHDKSSVGWKRKYVQQRVLQECLKMRKDTLHQTTSAKKFGCYGGKPLYAFARDINKYIAEMHPRLRRERKVKKALSEAVQVGKILDPCVVATRMEKHMKNWKDLEDKQFTQRVEESQEESKTMFAKKVALPPIRGVMTNFYKLPLPDDEPDDTLGTGSDLLRHTETDNQDNNPKHHVPNEKEALENKSINIVSKERDSDGKAVLKLPPIQTTKSYITNKT